jgi:Iron hydrogenase small subunit
MGEVGCARIFVSWPGMTFELPVLAGCIGGGGQPKSHDPLVLQKRMSSIYKIDEKAVLRRSNDNQEVQELYKDSLGTPGGPKAHHLLHTTYEDEHVHTVPPYSVPEKAGASTPI